MTADTIDTFKEWDVIVIGSGIGGATVAYDLALRGLEVLILEKGKRVTGAFSGDPGILPEGRIDRGWWPMPVRQKADDGTYGTIYAPVGCAVGGSSIHYAAALERMAETDFQPLGTAVRSGSAWPVSYEEFLPYYEAAETLYRVQPGCEVAAMQRLSEWDRALMEIMRDHGLRPDLLRVGIRYDSECEECIGRVCPRNCKADAQTVCLQEALRHRNCRLLQSCDVRSIDATAVRANGVRAVWEGREVRFSGRAVVLCAGAFRSPLMLLRSASPIWPAGLANGSDQVGRNLMFHTADIFAVWAPRRYDRRGRQRKAISVRDFYLWEGERLGYVQSMGIEVGRGAIAAHLKNAMQRYGVRSERVRSLLAALPSRIGAVVLGNAGLFAASTEDDPDPNNRVSLDSEHIDGTCFTYTMTDDLRRRAEALREKFAAAIRPWRLMRLSPTLSMNYGHACGTCRFGDDRDSSVLDRDCRTHELNNLFVVDASFMPRSGAINPSLTIAANALRVAPKIAAAAGT